MKRKFLKWWYRISGKADEARFMYIVALLISTDDDGYGMKLWERDYRHIWDVIKDSEDKPHR